MAPPYLSGNVYFDQDAGVTDVQTMMDNITAMALAATPPWTNPVAGKIVSPADVDGRSFSVQFTRIAATNIEALFTDGSGRTLTRRAGIASGSTINYYIGQFHMVMDWLNSGTPEGILAIMLDESPESQTSHDRWLVCNTSKNTVNTLDGSWLFGSVYGIRSAGTFALLDRGILAMPYTNASNGTTNGFQVRTLGGSNLWCPWIQMGDSTSSVYNIYGKWYQCLVTKDTFVAVDSEVSVPIDQSTTAIFRVLNMSAWAPGGAAYHDRLAVRIS